MPETTEPAVPIAPVSYESFTWKPQRPEAFSRAEILRQSGDFEAAVLPEIDTWAPSLTAEIAGDLEDASRKIVEFDRHAQSALGMGNPTLGPMSSILLRTESASSSQIEQLTTSAKQLALAELDEGGRSNSRVVIGNVRAMEAALLLAHDLSENSILQMHRTLMTHHIGFDITEAGIYRQEQVWLGGGDAGPRSAEFVPPHHSRVQQAMEDLIRFLAREDLPVLVQAAVGHAQFETIHPFIDGNGRTGRALVQSVLRNKALVSTMALPLSAGILTDTGRYFRALGSYRAGDAGPIIAEFARASRFAAVSGRQLLDDLSSALDDSRAQLAGIRRDATAWRLLPSLIAQPIITAQYLMRSLGLGEMAALRALTVLTERGVLTELTGHRRNRIFEHTGVLGVLDDYARQIKRATAG
jgi:Fic family protein